MRKRFEGPGKALIPYFISFKKPVSIPQLVRFAQESAKEDRRPIFAAIGEDGSILGGVDASDEFLDRKPEKTLAVNIGDQFALCVTGCILGEPDVAMLAVPFPAYPSQYEPLFRALRQLACYVLADDEVPGLKKTLVWGHLKGSEFMVDTIPAMIILVSRPTRGANLNEHFKVLRPLGVHQCWLMHDKVYHIEW